MRWLSAMLFAGGVLLLGLGLALSLVVGLTSMPSYLADWLFWSSVPLGALPLVMLFDLAGPGSGFGLEPVLRRMLLLMPVAALLMIPVLLRPDHLFGWAAGHGFSAPFGRAWMSHPALVGRSVAYFVIWIGLSLLFFWPVVPARVYRRRGLAAAGLFLYALSITLASVDWAMTTEANWISPEYGLLFAASQAAIATSFAVLFAGERWRQMFPTQAAALLIAIGAIWVFLQFMQFLVIWSADMPSDITFYLHRENLGSRIAIWIGFIGALMVPLLVLLSPRHRRRRNVLPAMAVLLLCTQALGMLWLVTPSLRSHYTVSGLDVLEFLGLAGITLGICLWPSVLPKAAIEAPQHG